MRITIPNTGKNASLQINKAKKEQTCRIDCFHYLGSSRLHSYLRFDAKQCRRAVAALLKAAEEMEKEK